MSRLTLKYTILYVEDVAKTLAFYQQAFSLEQKMLHEGGDYGELETGETTLAFSSLGLMQSLGKKVSRPIADSASFEIAFTTDDVAVVLSKAITSGAELVQDVEQMPWGQTTAYVRDINGFLVEICSPVSQA